MRRIFSIRNFLFVCFVFILAYVGLDLQDEYRKYGNFRAMQDPIVLSKDVDKTGLEDLNIAGGSLVNFNDLEKKLEEYPFQIIVVNGTGYSYGYIQGILENYLDYPHPVPSWKAGLRRLFYTGTLKVRPNLVVSEAQEAQRHGYSYVRLPIGSKYTTSDKNIDDFVTFFYSLPQDAFVFYHCRHGKGRTSMLLVMSDIMKNAPQVGLQDIVKRQHLLGSVDLFDVNPWTKGTYAVDLLKKRKEFIEKFYQFVCQRKAGGIQKWSQWHRQWKDKRK